jgi:hypothetical protein
MPLRVLSTTQFIIGKFGGSFVDVHRTPKEQTKGQYLSERPNPAVFGGAISVGMGPADCFKADPSDRRIYSIDTSGLPLPIEACTTPEALDAFAQQFRETVSGRSDPYLNRNASNDWASGSEYDILQSRYGQAVGYSGVTSDKIESVSAISFSITDDADWKPTQDEPIKVWYAKGTNSTSSSYGCGSDASISTPVIVSDARNEHGHNIANNGLRNSFSQYRGNRLYLEIRHGLNTENYFAMVSEPDYFIQIPKKNSLILARYLDTNDMNRRLYSGRRFRGDESIFELPRGRINIVFYADPCQVTFNGVTQGIG